MYFITMVNIDHRQITDSKVIGAFEDKQEAEDKIMANDNAIFIKGEDSYYDYAIIAQIQEGFQEESTDIKWFKYNRTEEDVEIETETFGKETIKKVIIDIKPVNVPQGFEDYKPTL